MELCIIHKIYIVYLCPYTLHVCQPNDLGPYSHLKRIYKRSLFFACTLFCESFPGKEEFFHAYHLARKRAFVPRVIKAGWAAAGIWPRDRQKMLQSHWVTEEPRTSAMRPLQPIILVQSPPRFNEIINPIKIATPKSSRKVLDLHRKMCAVNESFQASATRLLFRKIGKALYIANAKLAESESRCESLSDSLKKKRPKKRKIIEMEVQGTFVQMMDVRKVKISMGVQLEPPSPVPVEELVKEDERESSTAEDEIVVGELLSDTESGSNYSDDA
jgi:hypothetical protein